MSEPRIAKMQAVLAAEESPLRRELVELLFDAWLALPLVHLLGDPGLVPLICEALAHDNAERIKTRHVQPGIRRVAQGLSGREERVRDIYSVRGQGHVAQAVHSGEGPRFSWLRDAIDPNDLRQLLAPAIQHTLIQFAARLPLAGPLGAGAGGAALGGLVGRLGKQVQRSAGQLADMGKVMLSGLGGEVERRLQTAAREFTETATAEFRRALAARLESDEGRALSRKMRAQILEHVLGTRLDEIVDDFMRLPIDDIGHAVTDSLGHLRGQPWFKALLEVEVAAALEVLGQRSLREVLEEAGLLARARSLALSAFDPALKALLGSAAFGNWLTRWLAESEP